MDSSQCAQALQHCTTLLADYAAVQQGCLQSLLTSLSGHPVTAAAAGHVVKLAGSCQGCKGHLDDLVPGLDQVLTTAVWGEGVPR